MKLIMMKPTLCVPLKRLEVDDSFEPMDPHLFTRSGVMEESDRGDWEICHVEPGARVWATLMPNGNVHISDRDDHTCHAQVEAADVGELPRPSSGWGIKP